MPKPYHLWNMKSLFFSSLSFSLCAAVSTPFPTKSDMIFLGKPKIKSSTSAPNEPVYRTEMSGSPLMLTDSSYWPEERQLCRGTSESAYREGIQVLPQQVHPTRFCFPLCEITELSSLWYCHADKLQKVPRTGPVTYCKSFANCQQLSWLLTLQSLTAWASANCGQ